MSAALLRYVPIVMSILALLVASVVVGGTFSPREIPVVATEAPAVVAAPRAHRRLDPAATFTTIVERPLFSPSRRPAQPSPQPVLLQAKTEQVSAPPLSATLIGVFMSPAVNSAMVRLPNGKTTSVNEGESVDGWILKRVTADLAQFQSGTAVVDLAFPLFETSGSVSTVPNMPGSPVRRRR